MNKISNFDKIKEHLLERKRELEKEVTERERLSGTDKTVKDVGDEIFSITQESIELSLYNTEWQELNRINRALKLIETGEYGICQECGKQIAPRRLEVYPDATLCIACQEKQEDRHMNFI